MGIWKKSTLGRAGDTRKGPVMGRSRGAEAWARLCSWDEGPQDQEGRCWAEKQWRRAWRLGKGLRFCPRQ